MQNTVIEITFDEGSAGHKILTIFLGHCIKANYINKQAAGHYSVLKLIEDNFQLGNLGRGDTSVLSIDDIYRS